MTKRNKDHPVDPARSSGSSPPEDENGGADALLQALISNQLAAQARYRASGLVPGKAYVLTKDIYQSRHYRDGVSWGPMVRVFREGDRFVCGTYSAQHDPLFALTPLDTPSVRDGLSNEQAQDLLARCIENDRPLPGARDAAWRDVIQHVHEIPHTKGTLELLAKVDHFDRECFGDAGEVDSLL